MQAILDDEWKMLRASKNGLLVSDLMVSGDFLLFREASVRQVNCVTRFLELFCIMPRLQVSQEKMIIFF